MDDVLKWAELSVQEEYLESVAVAFTKSFRTSEGHLSDVTFVTVRGIGSDKKQKILNLVLKYSKHGSKSDDVLPIKMAIDTEILMYDKILPEFEKLQSERNVSGSFKSYVKCYKCLKFNNTGVVTLENLKTKGYETFNRKAAFNMEHCRAVLKEYAKLHAMSIAMRDQKKAVFDSLVSESKCVLVQLLKTADVRKGINKNIAQALRTLRARGDIALSERFEKVIGKDGAAKFLDIMELDEKQSVFIHGDCWNDNFLFKYEGASKNCPLELKIIDWQQSTLASPALDIAFFLYDVCSKNELDQLNELLEEYYSMFSDFLEDIGSDPKKLFTIEDLRRHWHKYSLAAVIDFMTLIKYVLQDEPAAEGETIREEFGEVKMIDADQYYSRIKDVINHYIKSSD